MGRIIGIWVSWTARLIFRWLSRVFAGCLISTFVVGLGAWSDALSMIFRGGGRGVLELRVGEGLLWGMDSISPFFISPSTR